MAYFQLPKIMIERSNNFDIVRLVSGEEQIVRYSHKFFLLNFLSNESSVFN